MNLIAQNLQSIQSAAGLGGVPTEAGGLVSNIVSYVFYISGFLLLIFMIMGGFQIMFAKGDPKAVAGGWSKVSNALIGFILIVLSYAITKVLGQVFGISVFGQIFN